ncbi:MerR family transcriptional regulator [Profundibacter amoris]|uniref:MerR family transcriptional regulator n=1 Tax=Profundibacter amoris TaxID=2171755 RepID=A0A347UH28_9RHOB|nr:MerR family transcriptional regulator [Profundibacter amoris]AXX98156.1 MerR family transcriptional regulator [Profundibacter amoris]
MAKSPDAFRTISEVAEWLDTPAHVLRFWESRFTQVKPVKRAGGRRYYRPNDMLLLGGIKKLLHDDGMTIKGVQKMLRTDGVKAVAALSRPIDPEDQGETIDLKPVPEPQPKPQSEPAEQVAQAAEPPAAPPPPESKPSPAPASPAPVTDDLFAATDSGAPADEQPADLLPDIAARLRKVDGKQIDSAKQARLSTIYSRLTALHARMKDATSPAQQS